MLTTQSADDSEIVYERHGDGQPLILLHGGMAPKEYWNPIIPYFEEYAAVIPRRPGFGTCLDDPAETSADKVLERETTYVRALVDVVDGSSILFGHSYGALTAIEAATNARSKQSSPTNRRFFPTSSGSTLILPTAWKHSSKRVSTVRR